MSSHSVLLLVVQLGLYKGLMYYPKGDDEGYFAGRHQGLQTALDFDSAVHVALLHCEEMPACISG